MQTAFSCLDKTGQINPMFFPEEDILNRLVVLFPETVHNILRLETRGIDLIEPCF